MLTKLLAALEKRKPHRIAGQLIDEAFHVSLLALIIARAVSIIIRFSSGVNMKK